MAAKKSAKELSKVWLSLQMARVCGVSYGVSIPAMTFVLKHFVLPSLIAAAHNWVGYASAVFVACLICGGIGYSAPTVQAFIASMLPKEGHIKADTKAWAWVVLIEGTLIAPIPHTSLTFALPMVSILFLAFINSYCAISFIVNSRVRPKDRPKN